MDWAMAMQSGQLLEKIKECPPGMKEAREKAVQFIQDLRSKAPEGTKILVGGFSQGALMATDIALTLDPALSVYLAAFSPFLVDIDYWKERAAAHGTKLQALVTHGRNDPLIPFMASQMLTSLLTEAGCQVKFEAHPGGHNLGDDRIIRACTTFFSKVLAS